jgi:hypothetical protein
MPLSPDAVCGVARAKEQKTTNFREYPCLSDAEVHHPNWKEGDWAMRDRNAKKCQFQVELLEGRIPPSTFGPSMTGAAQVAPMSVTVPYSERVTLVSTSGTPGTPGFVSTYIGNATHMGRITIVTTITSIDPDGTIHQDFVRTAANGDTMFGHTVVTPTGTLQITVIGGTGRFLGVTGSQTGTFSVGPDGVVTAEATGTLTFPNRGHR